MRCLLILSLCLILLSANAQKNPATQGPVPKLRSKDDSVQYALGVFMGQWIVKNGFVTLDQGLFMTGLNDMLRNKPRQIKDEAVGPLITSYQQSVQKDVAKKLEAQLFANLKDKPGLGKLPSGVQYFVHKQGKGIRPSESDSVIINFKGTLADGTLFEDTYSKKIAIATMPKSVMPGLADALQMMPEGSIWELYIPSAMAYGDKGNGTIIPPNSALIMLVELVLVKRNS
ncbi:MAG: FKBP-type peptidyl-prolyl cis-trans isomerase [Chitinophagaceae bacterium]|nr:FKBP-type peptidyl-prolyl cis-trans isomerase [Chitinophagaceae bacterium]